MRVATTTGCIVNSIFLSIQSRACGWLCRLNCPKIWCFEPLLSADKLSRVFDCLSLGRFPIFIFILLDRKFPHKDFYFIVCNAKLDPFPPFITFQRLKSAFLVQIVVLDQRTFGDEQKHCFRIFLVQKKFGVVSKAERKKRVVFLTEYLQMRTTQKWHQDDFWKWTFFELHCFPGRLTSYRKYP